ncbi:MAG: hypothetical protein ABIR54_22305 [Burkholderiaceae bacterium]
MINPSSYSACSEFYEVAKSVEFVRPYGGEDRRFRIDALLNLADGSFSTSAYLEESVTLQPSFPQSNGAFDRKPEAFRVWVAFSNIGWTNRTSADDAINQALGML